MKPLRKNSKWAGVINEAGAWADEFLPDLRKVKTLNIAVAERIRAAIDVAPPHIRRYLARHYAQRLKCDVSSIRRLVREVTYIDEDIQNKSQYRYVNRATGKYRDEHVPFILDVIKNRKMCKHAWQDYPELPRRHWETLYTSVQRKLFNMAPIPGYSGLKAQFIPASRSEDLYAFLLRYIPEEHLIVGYTMVEFVKTPQLITIDSILPYVPLPVPKPRAPARKFNKVEKEKTNEV